MLQFARRRDGLFSREFLALCFGVNTAHLPAVPPDLVHLPRRSRRVLAWNGSLSSLQILPHVLLSWADLAQSQTRTGKPIGDICAGWSPFAVEAAWRDLVVIPCDARYRPSRPDIEGEVRTALLELKADTRLPADFFPNGVNPDKSWGPIQRASVEVQNRKLGCFCDRLQDQSGRTLADRFFSTVVCHNGVPKFSSPQRFIKAQLPELLRVTDDALHIYPLCTFRPPWWSDGPLVEAVSIDCRPRLLRRIRATAQEHGFTFELRRPGVPTYWPPDHSDPLECSGRSLTAVFVRKS